MLKKALFAAVIASFFSFQSWGETVTVDGFTYSTSGTNATVTSGPKSGDLVIPATFTYGGTQYTVTSIGNSAFKGMTGLTSVTFPNTLTTTNASAFENCSGITKLDLGTSIQALGQNSFKGCTGLTSVTVPASLKKLSNYAFSGAGLINLVLPEGCEYIGNYTFSNCQSLQSVSFPASLTTFGSSVFVGCSSLETLQVAAGCKAISVQDGLLYNAGKSVLKVCPAKKSGAVTVPQTCTKVDADAFNGCSLLTSVALPEGMVSLGSAAFKGCTSLTQLSLGNSLTYISGDCFNGCSNLKNLILPQSLVTVADNNVFANMTSLESLILPAAVRGILGNNVFSGDEALKLLEIGPKVTGVGTGCFANLRSLEELNIKASTPLTVANNNSRFSEENYNNVIVTVPAQSLTNYMTAEPWKNFKNLKGDTPISGDNSASVLSMVNLERIDWAQVLPLSFRIANEGKNVISSLGVVFTINGQAQPLQTVSNLNILSGGIVPVEIPLTLNLGTYEMELQITKVNNADNENQASSFKFNLNVVDGVIPDDSPEATYANFKNLSTSGLKDGQKFMGAINFIDPNLAGCKVIGAKVYGLPKSDIENVKIWSSTTLNVNPNKDNNLVKWDGNVAYTKYYEPITLTEAGAYFGVTLDRKNASTNYTPLPLSSPANVTGGFLQSVDGGRFSNLSAQGTLQIVLILDKEGFLGNRLQAVGPVGTAAANKGQSLEVPVEIINYTGKEITSLHYTYSGDGQTHQGTITKTVPAFATVKQEISIPVEGIETPGNYELEVTMDQVNGAANVMEAKRLTIPFSVAMFAATHLPIMEEMTGTGCTWCPRGTLGITELGKTYLDFIAAAYHGFNTDDPMYLTTMGPFKTNRAPNAIFDRMVFDLDPFYGVGIGKKSMGIADIYETQRDLMAPANIGIKSSWNEDKTEATVEAEVEFSFVPKDETFQLGYLFTIDGAHGSTGAWSQRNAYSGETNSNPLLNTLCNGTFDLSTFNHVVIDASAWKGVYQCEGAKAADQFKDTRIFKVAESSLKDNSWLTDPENCDLSNVNVIVLLIDNQGRIRNARSARIGQDQPLISSVADMEEDFQSEPIYFDLMGRQVDNPQHGLFIKVQNNRTQKIIL